LVRKAFHSILNWAADFISLLYPNLCASCNAPLFRGEREVCTRCRSALPYTRFHNEKDNAVAQLFWGRTTVENATAYFVFRKGSRFQKILHKIKYRNNQNLGVEIGRWFGHELSGTDFSNVDIIVPLPLHPKKLQKRGYNQSELIARGISEIMQKPIDTSIVRRIIENPTQTKKGRYERWSNVEGIFELANKDKVTGKHILIVDDVVTTGSTLEACVSAVLKATDVKVSVAVLAMA
jgi:ComF family protein